MKLGILATVLLVAVALTAGTAAAYMGSGYGMGGSSGVGTGYSSYSMGSNYRGSYGDSYSPSWNHGYGHMNSMNSYSQMNEYHTSMHGNSYGSDHMSAVYRRPSTTSWGYNTRSRYARRGSAGWQ